MRFLEVVGGLMVPISNEELLVAERVRGHDGPYPRQQLDEREQELARRLVHRGVLDRTFIEGRMCYIYNDVEYVERD
jgi:hypothetical protein